MSTVLTNRANLVLRHLQNKLYKIATPSQSIFLKHREAIIQESNDEKLLSLFSNEVTLKQELNQLQQTIKEVKHNDNKIEFVTARNRKITVEKILNETVKTLNHSLLHSPNVVANQMKMQDVIGTWVPLQLGEQYLQTFDSGHLETTIQKKEQVEREERLILEKIANVKSKELDLNGRYEKTEILKSQVETIENQVRELKEGRNPEICERLRHVELKRTSSKRVLCAKKEKLQNDIDAVKKQIEEETKSHEFAMQELYQQLEEARTMQKESTKEQQESIDKLVETLKQKKKDREEILEKLLDLRIRYKTYQEEYEKQKVKREEKLQSEQYEAKRKEAEKIIQNRLALLYRSKYKKKKDPPKKKGGKKSKGNKKKKKSS